MQKQSLNCADARHLVHLAVGDDTLPEEELRLTDHLHVCSDCRAYHAGMVDAMHVIERVRDNDCDEIPMGSVWPALADKLKARQSRVYVPQGRRFNGAVAALCACSLLLAFVTAVQNLPSNYPDAISGFSPVSAVNVKLQNNGGSAQNHQRQLVQMAGPNGTILWVDPLTGQAYVPNIMQALDDGKSNLNF